MQDAIRKGRHTILKEDTSFLPHGESHYKAKLTEGDVVLIRRLFGTVPTSHIREQFNISYSTVYNVIHHINWKHVPY